LAATGISAAADAAKIQKNSFLVNVRFSSVPRRRRLIAHSKLVNAIEEQLQCAGAVT